MVLVFLSHHTQPLVLALALCCHALSRPACFVMHHKLLTTMCNIIMYKKCSSLRSQHFFPICAWSAYLPHALLYYRYLSIEINTARTLSLPHTLSLLPHTLSLLPHTLSLLPHTLSYYFTLSHSLTTLASHYLTLSHYPGLSQPRPPTVSLPKCLRMRTSNFLPQTRGRPISQW